LIAAGALAECARAKVNLYLHVVGRRADGYHLLDSLAVFPDIGDRVSAHPAADLSLAIHGPFAGDLAGNLDENLVLAAARILAETANIIPGVALSLEKNLPIASGIGGGSSDAAAALRLLSRLWGLDAVDLPAIAARLGADVPVCLDARAARMSGVGTHLTPPPRLPEAALLLVNPGSPVPTGQVFARRQGAFSCPPSLPPSWPDAVAMAADLGALGNDLEAPAIALCPAIGDVLAALRALPGVLLARMSGSGATCFGLFASVGAAEDAAHSLPSQWWARAGTLR
jgi:4-diphosphocytidyl-2-C-methyl-D-erythritol kinase